MIGEIYTFNLYLAGWLPCLAVLWTFSNARRIGQPGLCASQGMTDDRKIEVH